MSLLKYCSIPSMYQLFSLLCRLSCRCPCQKLGSRKISPSSLVDMHLGGQLALFSIQAMVLLMPSRCLKDSRCRTLFDALMSLEGKSVRFLRLFYPYSRQKGCHRPLATSSAEGWPPSPYNCRTWSRQNHEREMLLHRNEPFKRRKRLPWACRGVHPSRWQYSTSTPFASIFAPLMPKKLKSLVLNVSEHLKFFLIPSWSARNTLVFPRS